MKKIGFMLFALFLGLTCSYPGSGSCSAVPLAGAGMYASRDISSQREAADYLWKWIKGQQRYKGIKHLALRLEGREEAHGLVSWGFNLGENHPDHWVTVDWLRVDSQGNIFRYDVATDSYARVN